MTQPQIEPCFNCGSDRIDIIESIEEREPLERQYYCIVCRVAGPIGYSDDEALERWNLLPRSSPAVAPGLRDLRSVIDSRLKQYNEQLDVQRERSTGSNNDIKHISRLEGARSELSFVLRDIDRAAESAVIAVQGGTADRSVLNKLLSNWSIFEEMIRVMEDEKKYAFAGDYYSISSRHMFVQLKEGFKSLKTALDRGDFTAVPSAPGCERVKELWKLIEPWCTVEGNEQTIRHFDKFCAEMDTLGTPQGSDSPDGNCKDAIALNVRDEMERCWWIVKNYSPAVDEQTKLVLSDIMKKIDRCDEPAQSVEAKPPQDHLSPERQIVYRFLSLPLLRQANIAKELDLARSDEIYADRNVPYELIFKRAKEQRRLANLWDAIEEQSEEKMSYPNPFAPHTQPVSAGEAKERGDNELTT